MSTLQEAITALEENGRGHEVAEVEAIISLHGWNEAGWRAACDAVSKRSQNVLGHYRPAGAMTDREETRDSAHAYANFATGKRYYVFGQELAGAGVPEGRNGDYTLPHSVPVSWTDPVGMSKQFGNTPDGIRVRVRWYADNAGKLGFGPNRKRRAQIEVL